MKTNHPTNRRYELLLTAVIGLVFATGCASFKSCCDSDSGCTPTVTSSAFGSKGGTEATLYTLRNEHGAVATISSYGGTVTSLKVPDRDGKLVDVMLGSETLSGYLSNSAYFGAIIGRYGNRIAGGAFKLDGATYKLATNNGPNNLHGGPNGFDKQFWTAAKSGKGAALELHYRSADGEEGFPGNMDVTALISLTDDNELKIKYTAKTDKPTVCNLTYHPYFNLSGAGSGDVLDHLVWINADRFTPVNSVQIPTGELRPVAGTPFDFIKPTTIGTHIEANDEQIKFGGGYDHNFVINQKKPGQLTLQARVTSPKTGIAMEVLSTEPGLQFYTGNGLDGTVAAKEGKTYAKRGGFCLEPQHFPDSPNQAAFPSTTLRPGETYHNTIIYKFSAK